ncbi:unnamed protein product [Bemisia tabaci]|uniref:F-box domain-containing protein n=1 Tax=Bemisia tabaci TaxID=7038 RepID=A0A9P0G4F3_BEMTA|nr:PREDICTED: F-box only protein 9 [Bemisia tabaci]CAH0765710.1 unnamed protein product [Bemisia tabaci]
MDTPDGLLVSFREEWQKELELNSNPPSKGSKKLEEKLDNFSNLEDEAKTLFLKGAENERAGKHYEAIQFYKRAVQLVPDIEFRIYNSNKTVQFRSTETDDEDEPENQSNLGEDSLPVEDVILLVQREMAKDQNYSCLPENVQTDTHISALPFEILLYIFRWVVSRDLDLRSLESCALVCRSFYLCARDEELWKSACQQMWGLKVQPLQSPKHNRWRRTFVESPFIKTSGCYISKTSYIRHGENSFQDQSYRPWHLVTYYRYLRFFGGGQVLMLCTPIEPAQTVGQLRRRSCSNNSVLSGHYLISDDVVTVVFHQTTTTPISIFGSKNRKSKNVPKETTDSAFHMEFQILNYKSRLNVQLVWRRYALYQKKGNNPEIQSTFDLAHSRFPPLWYSRVKSYTTESEVPLL